eukprot:10810980-Lingulodinium_polyedra.AAC.1
MGAIDRFCARYGVSQPLPYTTVLSCIVPCPRKLFGVFSVARITWSQSRTEQLGITTRPKPFWPSR